MHGPEQRTSETDAQCSGVRESRRFKFSRRKNTSPFPHLVQPRTTARKPVFGLLWRLTRRPSLHLRPDGARTLLRVWSATPWLSWPEWLMAVPDLAASFGRGSRQRHKYLLLPGRVCCFYSYFPHIHATFFPPTPHQPAPGLGPGSGPEQPQHRQPPTEPPKNSALILAVCRFCRNQLPDSAAFWPGAPGVHYIDQTPEERRPLAAHREIRMEEGRSGRGTWEHREMEDERSDATGASGRRLGRGVGRRRGKGGGWRREILLANFCRPHGRQRTASTQRRGKELVANERYGLPLVLIGCAMNTLEGSQSSVPGRPSRRH